MKPTFFTKFLFRSLTPFCAGGVATANLALLIGRNPNYDPQWWKVVAGVVIALVVPHIIDEAQP